MARVFSQKHSTTSMVNGGIYSVGTKSVYQIWQFSKTECFAGISQEGLTRETLAKTSYLYPVMTLRIPVMCRVDALLRGKLTRELLAKTTLVFNCLESSHILSFTHTTLTNKFHMKYRVHNIEQNYNQIWHKIKANKNIVVNYKCFRNHRKRMKSRKVQNRLLTTKHLKLLIQNQPHTQIMTQVIHPQIIPIPQQ